MAKRLLIGPLLIAALVGLAWLDQGLSGREAPMHLRPWLGATWPLGSVLFPVILFVVVLSAIELSRLARAAGTAVSSPVVATAAGLGFFAMYLLPTLDAYQIAGPVLVTFAGACAVAGAMGVLRRSATTGAIASASVPVLAYVYPGLLAGMVFPLVRWGGNVFVLVYVLLIIKACDIGAFFTGTAVGKHKLIPWLSKGKTWEGLFGGVALAALAGWGGAAWIGPHTDVHAIPVTPTRGAVLGVVLALVGQGADLFESALKRDGGAKDSGRTIPGFGGMLDVIDSPLLALPVAYWLLRALS